MTGKQLFEAAELASGCKELGLQLRLDQRETLLRYLELLYLWNRKAGLTTIRPQDAVRLQLLDSLAAASELRGNSCVDLGSGAGLPGLPLAVARPEIDFLLVDSSRRRCSFLLEVLRTLSIPNARVLEANVDSLDRVFDTVLSRAFRPPAELLATCRRLLAPDGRILLLMATAEDEPLQQLAQRSSLALQQVKRLLLPLGGEPRAIVSFRSATGS